MERQQPKTWQVHVGSQNPTKVGAARRVARQCLGPETVVTALAVDSGVSEQPLGREETRQGALQRARRSLYSAAADGAAAAGGGRLGVGMEGGAVLEQDGARLINWVAAVDGSGCEEAVEGLEIRLPPAVAAAVRSRAELGPVMDRIKGRPGTARAGGAIGHFTLGAVSRQHLWEVTLACALVPFLPPYAAAADRLKRGDG